MTGAWIFPRTGEDTPEIRRSASDNYETDITRGCNCELDPVNVANLRDVINKGVKHAKGSPHSLILSLGAGILSQGFNGWAKYTDVVGAKHNSKVQSKRTTKLYDREAGMLEKLRSGLCAFRAKLSWVPTVSAMKCNEAEAIEWVQDNPGVKEPGGRSRSSVTAFREVSDPGDATSVSPRQGRG